MNITDVGHLTGDNEWDADHGEDRMEKGARIQWITARNVADMFTEIYKKDLAILHIDPLEFMPKATDHIKEQIAMIQELEAKWYTYSIPWDGVYMDTSKVEDYWVLTNKKNLENLESGSRVQDAGKKNPTDFALWKFNISWKKRDMERESPWWIGFPGRHIECSAMSMEYLWDHIDIHTGWMEHIAIHHTNEIVQSECSHGHKPRVNYWIHLQRLMMNGKKIAKSDGNVAFMSDVLDKEYSAYDLRYFFLQAHYRSFQDFTREALESAKRSRQNLKKKIQTQKEKTNFSMLDIATLNEKITQVRYIADWIEDQVSREGIYYEYEMNLAHRFNGTDEKSKIIGNHPENKNWKLMRDILEALLDDLNTAKALASLGEIISCDISGLYVLQWLDHHILKLWLFEIEEEEVIEIPAHIQELAAQRRQAKLDKDRTKSDTLRNQLQELGRNTKDNQDGYEIVKL